MSIPTTMIKRSAAIAVIAAAITAITATAAFADPGHHFSAGQPGDAKKPARIVQVVMREADGKMMFIPNTIEVRKGEQIRFIVRNIGDLDHEFVLATKVENHKHAEAMRKNPDMEHDDPNMAKIGSKKSVEMVWRFTKTGEFEFGCLIPGHYEAGMFGTIVVK